MMMIEQMEKKFRQVSKKCEWLFAGLLVITMWLPMPCNSQETDYGTWLDVGISKKIINKLNISVDEEVRIFQQFSEINRFATSVEADYSFFKFLKGTAGYTWIYRHDVNDSFWENRHRYYLQLNGKLNVNRIAISLREKFQSTYINKYVKGFDYSPENYLRSRLQVDWDAPNSKLQPYASAEMIYQLNNPDGNVVDNWRFTAGTDFPLAKNLKLDTYLRLSQEINVKNPVNLYLIGLTLNWNL
jgi:hypothetical protein